MKESEEEREEEEKANRKHNRLGYDDRVYATAARH